MKKQSQRSASIESLTSKIPQAGSFAITIFGDLISVHGGEVWLGGFVKLMSCFGLNEQQVRTALFRLSRDNWLIAKVVGRRSYYKFAPEGLRQFEQVAERIYAASLPNWEGEWTFVMADAVRGRERDNLRRRLGWLGFGLLPSGLLIHPTSNQETLKETINDLGMSDNVIVWKGYLQDSDRAGEVSSIAWDLAATELKYKEFVNLYEAFVPFVSGLSDLESFILRCRLVHDYRRILLRSPDLPEDLLPENWSGLKAMSIMVDIYKSIHEKSWRFAQSALENSSGVFPAPVLDYYARLGGLRAGINYHDGILSLDERSAL